MSLERSEGCYPLPHVLGFPKLRVLSSSLTPNSASLPPRVRGLLAGTASSPAKTGLPCSHRISCIHAVDDNPENLTPPRLMRWFHTVFPTNSGRSTILITRYRDNFSFTCITACTRPVYASRYLFPTSPVGPPIAQHSVPSCWLDFTRAGISSRKILCAFHGARVMMISGV